MNEEVWKDIEGYEGLYQVSNMGRVRSLDHYTYRRFNFGVCKEMFYKGKVLKAIIDKDGYELTNFGKGAKQEMHKVHRLVANAFIPKIEGKDQVNHKDGNKRNNRVENLECCNASENQLHSIYVLVHKNPIPKAFVKKQLEQRKRVICVELNKEFSSCKEASLWLGLNRSAVCSTLRGFSKTTGGYHWRYVE